MTNNEKIIALIVIFICCHFIISLGMYLIDDGYGFYYCLLSKTALMPKKMLLDTNDLDIFEITNQLKVRLKLWFMIPLFQIGSVVGLIYVIKRNKW